MEYRYLFGAVSIGGGYNYRRKGVHGAYGATDAAVLVGGASGVTISDIGAISANNVLTVDGVSTLLSQVDIGGGYGSAGVTITDGGAQSPRFYTFVGRYRGQKHAKKKP